MVKKFHPFLPNFYSIFYKFSVEFDNFSVDFYLFLDDKPCEIHAMQDYELCLNISDCDICTVNPHCGWCEASGQCLPGNKGYSSCAHSCVNGWVFGERSCTNKVRAGRFSNIAPEVTIFLILTPNIRLLCDINFFRLKDL
jgi:hypothetical protein